MTECKTLKALRRLIAQIDALLPDLADKPSKQADLLLEKSGLLNRISLIEEQTAKIAELREQLALAKATARPMSPEEVALQVYEASKNANGGTAE